MRYKYTISFKKIPENVHKGSQFNHEQDSSFICVNNTAERNSLQLCDKPYTSTDDHVYLGHIKAIFGFVSSTSPSREMQKIYLKSKTIP